jgi:predicted histone-like DNA-binding protein
MAKIFYQLRQNKNVKSKIYGKWFAHSKSVETMNTRKLSQHISEHGSIYTPDVVFGVLEKFRSCLLEMLLESKSVKIDGLGTFYTTLENEPGGADKEEDFNVQKNLKALHIRFIPEQEQELNISSREFIKKAEFVNVDSMKSGEKKTASGNGSDSGGGNGGNGGGGGNTQPSGDVPGEGD